MHGMRMAVAGLLIAMSQAATGQAADCVWSGSGANNNWSTSGNWTSCHGSFSGPTAGDTVNFPAGSPRATSVNNIAGLSLNGITITGAPVGATAYEITGQAVTLLGEFRATERSTFRAPLVLGATLAIRSTSSATLVLGAIALNGFGLTLDCGANLHVSAIDGAGAVIKTGSGELSLSDGSYTGSTQILDGVVAVNGLGALGAGGSGNGTFVSNGTALRINTSGPIDEPLVLAGDGVSAQGALVSFVDEDDPPPILTGQITLNASTSISIPPGGTLVLAGRIVASAPDRALTKSGERGTLVLSNPNNTLPTLNIAGGIVQIGAAGAIPDNTNVHLLTALATFDVNGISETIGGLIGTAGIVQLGTGALTVNCATATSSAYAGEIRGAGALIKAGPGILRLAGTTANSYAGGTTILAGQLQLSATSGGAAGFGPLTVIGGTLTTELAEQIADSAVVRIDSPGIWRLYTTETIGSLSGSGRFEVLIDSPRKGALIVGGNDASTTFTGTSGGQTTAPFAVTKVGRGTLTLTGANDVIGNWRVAAGRLILNGPTNSGASLSLDGGVLGGTGPVAHLIGGGGATVGSLSPGSSPARFTVTDALIGGPVVIDLDGPTAGSGYDQLQASGPVRLTTTASLQVRRTFPAPAGSRFTIIDNAVAMIGTFAGLPEGGTLSADGQRFGISYSGGDGHDVVLTALEDPPRLTYYLAEGATGPFFDEDVLIANPNRDEAPVTITFLKDTGEQVEISRTLPAESHLMIHVDEIPGLEGAAASAQIVSRSGQPLFVERSMFWGATYYAGHTGSAISEPAPDWFFAEGAQGYFSTFVLIVNPNDNAADVTFTFLREGESPVVKTVAVGPRARLTVGAGDFAELRARSFGIRVHATQPIMAERAMYFGSLPGRLWGGGHESAGVAEPSMQWYLAEGATGGYFDTFILLSNPQGSPASVTVTYLLPTGETVTAQKTIAANGRLTVNPEAEGDARLRNATVSTVVTADVPIVAERSMYWPGATRPWGEAHNSFGVTAPRTEWGLAEGRLGGRVPFSTYILLANPGITPAEVEVKFLRDTGASIVATYTVPATGRYTIDVSSIAALRGSSFGAAIQVTNNVPIFVERSMYWDANGVFWSGGTNGTAIPWSVPR